MKRYLTLIALAILASPAMAFASDGAAAGDGTSGLIGLGAGLGIGLAALGGALGQGKLVSSGLEAIGRNPASSGKLFVPLILGLVFVEAIVILAFVIAIQLKGVM